MAGEAVTPSVNHAEMAKGYHALMAGLVKAREGLKWDSEAGGCSAEAVAIQDGYEVCVSLKRHVPK